MGLYFIYQSGQPWQMSDYSYYAADRTAQGSTSTSDTNRYSEPAGFRTTPSHNQFDVTYTQIFWKSSRYRLEGMVDIYNLFNKQTGYNFQPSVHATFPGAPVSYYARPLRRCAGRGNRGDSGGADHASGQNELAGRVAPR